jgi:hypothetical protein
LFSRFSIDALIGGHSQHAATPVPGEAELSKDGHHWANAKEQKTVQITPDMAAGMINCTTSEKQSRGECTTHVTVATVMIGGRVSNAEHPRHA